MDRFKAMKAGIWGDVVTLVRAPDGDFMRVSDHEAEIARLQEELKQGINHAVYLAKALHSRHYSEVTQWEVLGTLPGVLSQIDNMASGLKRQHWVSVDERLPDDPQARYDCAYEKNGMPEISRDLSGSLVYLWCTGQMGEKNGKPYAWRVHVPDLLPPLPPTGDSHEG